MAIVGAIICFIFCLIGYYSEKKIILNPITVFCGIWMVILFLSTLGYYTMDVASENTFMIMTFGIVFYIIGYYVNKLLLNKWHIALNGKTRISIDKNCKAVPRYNLLYFLLILCILFSLFNFVNVVRQVGIFSLGMVQTLLQSGDYDSNYNAIMGALSVLIVAPVSFAIPAITAVDFWYGKRDRKLLGLTIVLLVVRMLSSANRTGFILFFVYLIVTAIIYLYHHKRRNLINDSTKPSMARKIRKYIFGLAIFGSLAFILMTMSRGSKLFKNIYLDLAMPPRMFEIWAETIEKNDVHGYGIGSFLGFVYPIFYFLKNLLRLGKLPDIVQAMFDWTLLTDSSWVWPGRNIKANAYVSLFWFFYLDGRFLGVLIGSFIFGMIASRSFTNVVSREHSARQVATYCLIFYSILYSFVRFQFTLYKFALAVVFVMFFAYRMVPKNGESNQ